MMKIIPVALLMAIPLLASCAPSPVYVPQKRVKGAVTAGEIPRDARGEPVWHAIQRPPSQRNQAPEMEGLNHNMAPPYPGSQTISPAQPPSGEDW